MGRKANRSIRKKGQAKGPLILVLLGAAVAVIVGLLVLSDRWSDERERPLREATPHRPLPPRQVPVPAVPEPAEPGEVPEPPVAVKGEGKLAIIIDDMGSSMEEARTFMSMKTPLTFAIIPGLAKDSQVAEAAHAQGYEVIVHLPMEPQGYPQRRIERNGLLIAMSDYEIEERVAEYLRAVPHADGGNNHMGSRFTEVREKMLPALRVMNGSGFFFIDSRTSPVSTGASVARELGMKTASRNVFLDNVQEVGAIRRQLNQAAAIARKRGRAIAIGHPHRATMQALAAAIPVLKAQGITFTFARDMVN